MEKNEAFKLLQDDLLMELGLQPKERNKEYANLTQEKFLELGISAVAHLLWRDKDMLQGMLEIHSRLFRELNPHVARIKKSEDGPSFEHMYSYTQEVDDTGRTQEELDNLAKIIYPDIDRRQLELVAAEQYLHDTFGSKRSHTIQQPKQAASQACNTTLENPNPVINFKDLCKKLKVYLHREDTVRKAVDRSIQACFNKRPLPYPIGGCASDYEVVDAMVRGASVKPTPKNCKFRLVCRDEQC